LERIDVTEPGDLTTMTLTSTQQALLLGLWSVTDLSYAIYTTLLSAVEIDNWKQTV